VSAVKVEVSLSNSLFLLQFLSKKTGKSWSLPRKRFLVAVSNELPLFVDTPFDMAMSSRYIAQQPTDKSSLAVIEAVNTGIE
jgi:hypothetical protein